MKEFFRRINFANIKGKSVNDNMPLGMLTIYGYMGTLSLGGWAFVKWDFDEMVVRGFILSLVFALVGTYNLNKEEK